MGQSNSRIRSPQPPQTRPPAQAQASSAPTSSTSTNPPSASSSSSSSNGAIPQPDLSSTTSNARKRPGSSNNRASLRHSILGLIPHSHSRSSSTSSASGAPSADAQAATRKRWRTSRRWSKTPAPSPAMAEPPRVDNIQGEGEREASITPRDLSMPSATPEMISSEVPPITLPEVMPKNEGMPSSAPEVISTGSCAEIQVHEPSALSPDNAHNTIPGFSGLSPSPSLLISSPVPSTPASSARRSPISVHPPASDPGSDIPPLLTGESSIFGVHDSEATFAEQMEAPSAMPSSVPPRLMPELERPSDVAAFGGPQRVPGTLVVVQGVVNTTDSGSSLSSQQQSSSATATQSASTRRTRGHGTRPLSAFHPHANTSNTGTTMRRSASTPRSPNDERSGTRSRLSSFLQRPNSMLLGHRPSLSDAADGVAPSQENIDPATVSGSLSDSSETVSAEESATGSSSSEREPLAPENDRRSRALSPGSIDVLGTLLSVAAAATAASLISPSLVTASAAPTGGADINRPTSPTPTAGLGTFGALGGLAGLGVEPGGPANPGRESRDRVRNVWESFRDRLGLNGRAGGGAGEEGTGEGGGAAVAEPRMRPGEMMLAEMTRALNVGLGLQTDGEGARAGAFGPAPVTGEDGRPGEGQEPPEHSFERFLSNLRADLRVALSEDGLGAGELREGEGESEGEGEDSEASASPASEALDLAAEPSDGALDGIPPLVDSDSEDDEDEDEDEEEDGEEQGEDDHAAHAHRLHSRTRTPTPIPSFNGLPFLPDPRPAPSTRAAGTAGTGAGAERRPGINLWRLYRFQPIQANQANQAHQTHAPQADAATTAGSGVAGSSLSMPQASAVSLPSTSSESNASMPPLGSSSASEFGTAEEADMPPAHATHPSHDARTDAQNNVVVPVIVVGLQSVDVSSTHEQEHEREHEREHGHGSVDHDHDHDHGDFGQQHQHHTHHQHFNHDGQGSSGFGEPTRLPTDAASGSSSSRGRSWQSRAANALRTLRPGRRGGSRSRRNTDAAGSRTFLIYVIGGYYPPNHHIVTAPDSLDSYEALWELAELLGQVKPPVATREDIDNSGLQIINVADLTRLEQEGRVAASCVDRCLICLDDYEGVDDLRLMSCKHAFHKDCVDKWLQVGRNNCPACRSKGVSTAGETAA